MLDLAAVDDNIYEMEEAFVVPIQDRHGHEQMLILDKSTDIAKSVLDGVFGMGQAAV